MRRGEGRCILDVALQWNLDIQFGDKLCCGTIEHLPSPRYCMHCACHTLHTRAGELRFCYRWRERNCSAYKPAVAGAIRHQFH